MRKASVKQCRTFPFNYTVNNTEPLLQLTPYGAGIYTRLHASFFGTREVAAQREQWRFIEKSRREG